MLRPNLEGNERSGQRLDRALPLCAARPEAGHVLDLKDSAEWFLPGTAGYGLGGCELGRFFFSSGTVIGGDRDLRPWGFRGRKRFVQGLSNRSVRGSAIGERN